MKTFAEILGMFASDDFNIESLDEETLAEYREVLRSGVLDLTQLDEITSEALSEIREGKSALDVIDAEVERRAALNDELDDIVKSLSDEAEEEEEIEVVVEEDEASTLSDTSDDDEDGEEDDGEEDDGEDAVTASAPVARRRSAAEIDAAAPATPPAPVMVPAIKRFTATSGVSGMAAGEEFEDGAALGEALVKRFKDIKGGGTEKIAVANLEGNFTDEMTLVPGDTMGNMAKLGGGDPTRPEALTASLACVPRQPLYDVGIDSSTARPVLASLPRRRAPRGGYLVYPHPLLSDVLDATGSGDGTGVWTEDEDDDPNAVKNACAVITCSTPVQYDIYGVYRCITVRNLLNMTFPELVEAYLNKLTALWARLAEVTLLDAMVNSTNTVDITATAGTFSASQNIIELVNRLTAVYREQERYGSVELHAWMPRWVQRMLVSDAALLTKYDSTLADRVVTEADINRLFSDLGVNVTWTLDNATGWQALGPQAAGALNSFPTTTDIIFSPEGNFQALDQGNLQVGVTNRVPWDLDDMARNQFTMFWESYEGLLDLGAPTWTFRISSLDPNGQQRALV